jgi:hypothetical protein
MRETMARYGGRRSCACGKVYVDIIEGGIYPSCPEMAAQMKIRQSEHNNQTVPMFCDSPECKKLEHEFKLKMAPAFEKLRETYKNAFPNGITINSNFRSVEEYEKLKNEQK